MKTSTGGWEEAPDVRVKQNESANIPLPGLSDRGGNGPVCLKECWEHQCFATCYGKFVILSHQREAQIWASLGLVEAALSSQISILQPTFKLCYYIYINTKTSFVWRHVACLLSSWDARLVRHCTPEYYAPNSLLGTKITWSNNLQFVICTQKVACVLVHWQSIYSSWKSFLFLIDRSWLYGSHSKPYLKLTCANPLAFFSFFFNFPVWRGVA